MKTGVTVEATPADLHALATPTPDQQQRAGDPEDLGTIGEMLALVDLIGGPATTIRRFTRQ